jgi:hypothetical protein
METPSELPARKAGKTNGHASANETVDAIRALLTADVRLPRKAADALADSVERLYGAVASEEPAKTSP